MLPRFFKPEVAVAEIMRESGETMKSFITGLTDGQDAQPDEARRLAIDPVRA